MVQHTEAVLTPNNLRHLLGESELRIGLVTKHPDGRTVKIVSGQYLGMYGVSNFWKWREVKPNGILSEKEESGYGWM